MKGIFNISIFLIIFKINAIIVDRNLLENPNLFYKITFTNCAEFNVFRLKKESYFQGNLAGKDIPDYENMYIYFHISSDVIDSSYHMAYDGYSSAIFFQFKYDTNQVNQIGPVGGISLRYSSCENNNLVFLNTRQEKVLFELQKIKFYAYKQQDSFKNKRLVEDKSSKTHLIELLEQLKRAKNKKQVEELEGKILNVLLENPQMLLIVKIIISPDKNNSYYNTYFFIDKMNDNTLYFYNENQMWIETEFKLNQSQIKITPDYLTFTADIDGKHEFFTISLTYIEFYKLGDGVHVPYGIVLSKNRRRYSPSDLSSEFKEFKEFKKKAPSESEENKTSEEIELKEFPRLESETTKTYYDDLES